MSDIICARCGEPWDSTGGIHHSHSDLNVIQYEVLLEGRGCPCCHGDPQHFVDIDHATVIEISDEERKRWVEQWRKSVERLSEGDPNYMYETFEKEPLPPYIDERRYEGKAT